MALGLLALPGAARADDGDPLGPAPRRLDVFLGPVQGSSRAVGVSGAFVSIAEGVEGLLWNPAAVANRYPYSLDWWDWDLDVGLLVPTDVGGQDFDNDGRTKAGYKGANLALFGGALSFGYLGFGFEGSRQGYTIEAGEPGDAGDADVALWTVHASAAFALLHGQLIAGLGLRYVSLGIQTGGGPLDGGDSLNRQTPGFEAGVLIRPDDQPFRFAAVGRTPLSAMVPRVVPSGEVDDPATEEDESRMTVEDCSTAGLPNGPLDRYLPCAVEQPWEVELGFSWMFGPRAYNPRWNNPRADRKRLQHELEEVRQQRWQGVQAQLAQVPPEEYTATAERLQAEEQRLRDREDRGLDRDVRRLQRERAEALARAPRRYLLVSADLVITGDTEDAIGIEAYVRQEEQASGDALSFTPRLGAESEPLHDRLRLRAGGYLEPSRFTDVGPRPHGTFGLDVRLFYTTFFDLLSRFGVRASGMIDVAPRYLQWAVSLGIWH